LVGVHGRSPKRLYKWEKTWENWGETYFGTSSINGGFMMFMAYHRHQAIKPCLWQSHRSFANFGGQADDSFFIFIF
jgi:hypothetical protein